MSVWAWKAGDQVVVDTDMLVHRHGVVRDTLPNGLVLVVIDGAVFRFRPWQLSGA